jgi:hypothetical protein
MKYPLIFLIGFIIWILENIFFGWNHKPESSFEGVMDILSAILIFWGVVGDIVSNLHIHKHTDVNAKEVKIVMEKEEI